MARPTVAAERRDQIIEATLQTVAQHGIAGTSLDRIAEAAGMSRGHVRHFVGNRDQLLAETARHVFSDETGTLTILPSTLESFTDALDYLFGEDFTRSDAENAVVLGFVELSRTNPAIAEVLAEAYGSTRSRLAELAASQYPHADAAARELAADATLSAALGNVFMGDFDPDKVRTARVRRAVETLLSAI
ncbi:MAG: TetR/AcrR family transcriptional regulator [Rhodoglobus sp.]|uniref:TetR/AcrR family transcriptional regulator n=1 Tax=unclassified Microbacterium TaxID=2609290 RepID=UPI0010694FC8|nr:TetR/AcrR family transcriptional regulator [Microbacterium sp. 3H14]MDZ4046291.1 TetR/AcrR family transcriptional regulator [Rhodoglobus sp.]TFB16013.1 TetR/AcrR family transcriptional regulator [Microbacterium sp. 3H14]